MDISVFVKDNMASLAYAIPEMVLATWILVVIIADLIIGRRRSAWTSIIALVGLVVTGIAVYQQYGLDARSIFSNMLAMDPFALYFKLIFLFAAAFTIFLSFGSIELSGRPVGEYFSLLLATTLGMFLMAAATNLVTIFIAVELVSNASFVLAAYLKTRRRSSEAGLKYAIYGIFSSGLMIYGLSLIYGLTGTLNIYEIRDALAANPVDPLVLFVAVLLALAGFGYKIAAVPFHFWAPDVYEGAPTPITAFFSVGPKAAGFALLIRFFNVSLVSPEAANGAWTALSSINWPQILAAVSAATMTLGNLLAISQRNLKRLLAYSSIAHAGYALMGTVVLNEQGIHATIFYLVVYYLMNMGAFLVVIINQDLLNSEDIDAYKGLVWRAPIPAVAMSVFLFSLTGLPPTGGFIGKFYLFAALINSGPQFYWLAVVGLLNSVISLYYYARILRAMFIDPVEEPATARLSVSPLFVTLLAVLAIPIVLLGVYWAPLSDLATYSVSFLRIL
jgi:NADH-quinone oxidoreductase subunit N